MTSVLTELALVCRLERCRPCGVVPLILCLLLIDCRARPADVSPSIEFTKVPRAAEGGPALVATIEGRAIGARPGQQVVLFARSGDWFVQPFADRPFTRIDREGAWTSETHFGTDYAALIVEPGYHPPSRVGMPPGVGDGVVAVAITKGAPMFWQTWWFRVTCLLVGVAAILAFNQMRMSQLARQLNVRFEERLAERTRIAQDLHDTLLQGFVSASMQLHVAVDRLPADSAAKPPLDQVLRLMAQVIEEGRNAVRGLRSSSHGAYDLEEAFSAIQQELSGQRYVGCRVIVEGRPRPLRPLIRDEVYRIGREALLNAFRHSSATRIEVELEYAPHRLRVLVRDDGRGIDPEVLQVGRDGHWGLSGMRERAESMGGRLKVWSRDAAGTEVEMSIPSHVAFEAGPSARAQTWWARLHPRRAVAAPREEETKRPV